MCNKIFKGPLLQMHHSTVTDHPCCGPQQCLVFNTCRLLFTTHFNNWSARLYSSFRQLLQYPYGCSLTHHSWLKGDFLFRAHTSLPIATFSFTSVSWSDLLYLPDSYKPIHNKLSTWKSSNFNTHNHTNWILGCTAGSITVTFIQKLPTVSVCF